MKPLVICSAKGQTASPVQTPQAKRGCGKQAGFKETKKNKKKSWWGTTVVFPAEI